MTAKVTSPTSIFTLLHQGDIPDSTFKHVCDRDNTKTVELTVRKSQNTYDQKEGDDQDEPHPEVTVTISIISAGSKVKLVSMTNKHITYY